MGFELVDLSKHKDLDELRKEKFEKALRAMVTGEVDPLDFPSKRIPMRPIRGGTDAEYVPGWWFDENGNALFNHLWSYEVLEKNIGQDQLWVLGKLTIHVPGRTEITEITHKDGTVEKKTVIYEALNIVKEQFGGSDVKKASQTGKIIDIGDDLKSAATDAKKKCWTELGFASTIYGKREILTQTQPQITQFETLYKMGSKILKENGVPWTIDDVKAYCKLKYGKEPAELEVAITIGLIAEFRKMVGKKVNPNAVKFSEKV